MSNKVLAAEVFAEKKSSFIIRVNIAAASTGHPCLSIRAAFLFVLTVEVD